MCDHLDGTPKYLHGGIHYLIGDGTDGHFWSLVINFLQTGNALPMSTTSVARGLVRKKTWVALNREWTAILLAARDDPNNVMCMWHHKPSGCCVNASGRCPFVHTSSPPLSLAELLRSPAPSSSKESPLVCSNCGAESAQDGGPLKRCSQCKNIDSMYCSR